MLVGVFVIEDDGVGLSTVFVFLDALDAEALQFSLEIVEHDCVGQALEDEAEFPPPVRMR